MILLDVVVKIIFFGGCAIVALGFFKCMLRLHGTNAIADLWVRTQYAAENRQSAKIAGIIGAHEFLKIIFYKNDSLLVFRVAIVSFILNATLFWYFLLSGAPEKLGATQCANFQYGVLVLVFIRFIIATFIVECISVMLSMKFAIMARKHGRYRYMWYGVMVVYTLTQLCPAILSFLVDSANAPEPCSGSGYSEMLSLDSFLSSFYSPTLFAIVLLFQVKAVWILTLLPSVLSCAFPLIAAFTFSALFNGSFVARFIANKLDTLAGMKSASIVLWGFAVAGFAGTINTIFQ